MRLVLQTFRATTMDALADCGSAFDARARAIEADGIHDAALIRARHVAALGAEEADIFGCGCSVRFDRLLGLISDAQTADAREDGYLARAFALFGQAIGRLRQLAGTADRLLTGGTP